MNTTAYRLMLLLVGSLLLGACNRSAQATDPAATAPAAASGKYKNVERTDKVTKSEDQWKKELTAEQFEILRNKGTERAFTGKLWDNHADGTYLCAGCGLELFDSKTKFESGTGWPSFFKPLAEDRVQVGTDNTHGMTRDEVTCARCGGHLGHVFDDGPKPTGLRYCMNSASMKFEAPKSSTTKP